MPPGLEATMPLPAPLVVTLSIYMLGSGATAPVNAAVTFRAAVILTLQLPVPVHAPPQPVKVEPAAGAAVRVTEVPEL